MMKKINGYIGVSFAVVGIVFFLMAIRQNPTDAEQKFLTMRHDMNVILAKGGTVSIESSNSKYASAYLYVGIDAATWSPDLADSYIRGLGALGWMEMNKDGVIFLCKDGISAEVHRNVEYGGGKAMYGINMTYNSLTIRRCTRK
jgi:hypothetical protein